MIFCVCGPVSLIDKRMMDIPVGFGVNEYHFIVVFLSFFYLLLEVCRVLVSFTGHLEAVLDPY